VLEEQAFLLSQLDDDPGEEQGQSQQTAERSRARAVPVKARRRPL
jgi:hypothetical protein